MGLSFSCTSRTLPRARCEWELCFGELCTLKESCGTAKRCSPPLQKKHMGCGVLTARQGAVLSEQRQPGCALWVSLLLELYTLQGTGGVPPTSLSSLVVGLGIYMLTFLLNTSKTDLLLQFCELMVFNVFPWLNASAVLMWQCLQLFNTSFTPLQLVQIVPGNQRITFFFVSSDPVREQFYRVKKPQATSSRKLQSMSVFSFLSHLRVISNSKISCGVVHQDEIRLRTFLYHFQKIISCNTY